MPLHDRSEEYAKLDRVYAAARNLQDAIQDTEQYRAWKKEEQAKVDEGIKDGSIDIDEVLGPLGGWGFDIHVTHFTTHTQVKFNDQLLDDDRDI